VAAFAFVALFVFQCVRRQRDLLSTSDRSLKPKRARLSLTRRKYTPRRNQTAPSFEVWKSEADCATPTKPTLPRVPVDSDSSPEQARTDSPDKATDAPTSKLSIRQLPVTSSDGPPVSEAAAFDAHPSSHADKVGAAQQRDGAQIDTRQNQSASSLSGEPSTPKATAASVLSVRLERASERSVDALLQAPTPVQRQVRHLPPIGQDRRKPPSLQHDSSPTKEATTGALERATAEQATAEQMGAEQAAAEQSTAAPCTMTAAGQPHTPAAFSVAAVAVTDPTPAAVASVAEAASDVPRVEQTDVVPPTRDQSVCAAGDGAADPLAEQSKHATQACHNVQSPSAPAGAGTDDALPAIQPTTASNVVQHEKRSLYGGLWRDVHR